MGISDWLMNLGIRAEGAVQGLGSMAGVVPLGWPAGPRNSLIYRLPRDPHQRASIFAQTQMIIVNEGEEAVVLEDGASHGALPAGRYLFQKARVVGALDVVWIAVGQQSTKWGVGNVTSADGIQLSANGALYIRIQDARLFNSQVVQGAITLTDVELQRSLLPRVQGVIRSVLAKWPALDLQTQRELFSDAVRGSLNDSFAGLGIGISDFEVVEVNFPAEFKAVIAQAAMAGHGSRAALIEAQTRAQITQLEAAASAQAQLATGMAQVQLMSQMQAQGIDPMKLKALEALNTFAANPTQGMMVGGDPARAALFGQVATAAIAAPIASMAFSAALPAAAAPAAAPPALPAAGADAPPPAETVESLERQLDQLTEKLADGKLTEETFNKLSARIEGKLAKLRG
jgi:regulator of protease activity HflC (stomatin/prohibitin superfamily)